jgi:ketosteroid isomerase-like protein
MNSPFCKQEVAVTRVVPAVLLLLSGLTAMHKECVAGDSPPNLAEREIRELEDQFEQAVVKGDLKFFEKALAKEFTHTTQSGVFRNREEWLSNHKAGQSNYDALNTNQVAIRLYGDTAIVTARIAPHGRTFEGQPIEGQYRYLRVWVKQDGTWRVVAFQSTRIADAKKGGTR